MSPTATRSIPEPVLGPLAKRAARLPLRPPLEKKHRLLLTLIAASADAGEASPPMRELVRRLGMAGEKWGASKLDKQLRELKRAGVLEVAWRASGHEHPRNVYELRLGGGVRP